eukprot:8668_1
MKSDLKNDIKLIKQYFQVNKLNLFLSIATNVFIAFLIPIITFFVILPSESMIDVVLNSTAIIFVIDLDDEGAAEIDYDQWWTKHDQNFIKIFKQYFSIEKFDDLDKDKQLIDFWMEIKQDNKEDIENNHNGYLMDIGLLLILPVHLMYTSFDIMADFSGIKDWIMQKCFRNNIDNHDKLPNDSNVKNDYKEIKQKIDDGKLLQCIESFNELDDTDQNNDSRKCTILSDLYMLRGEIENNLRCIIFCNPIERYKNALKQLNDVKQEHNKNKRLKTLLKLYEYKKVTKEYDETKDNFITKTINRLKKFNEKTQTYATNKHNATKSYSTAIQGFDTIISDINKYQSTDTSIAESFSKSLKSVNDACNDAIGYDSQQCQYYLIKLQINSILIEQINKLLSQIPNAIANIKYNHFLQVISIAKEQKEEEGLEENNKYILKEMLSNESLTVSTFKNYCTENEWYELIETYFPVIKWDEYKQLYEKIMQQIHLKDDKQVTEKFNNQKNIIKNQLESLKQQKRVLKKECRDNIRNIYKISSFYGCLHDNILRKSNKEGDIIKYNNGMNDGIELFDKKIRSYPDEGYFFWMRGKCYLNIKNFEQSMKDFNKAYELNENNALFLYYVGVVSNRLDKKTIAITNYKNAFKMMQDEITKHFYYSIENKVYNAFYNYCYNETTEDNTGTHVA